MSSAKGVGPKIREMLIGGSSFRVISETLGVAKATISYHARLVGLSKAERPQYDWLKVQEMFDAGVTVAGVIKHFGMSRATIDLARGRGRISYLTRARMSAHEYASDIRGKIAMPHHRRQMRRKLLREGTEYRCVICGITEWCEKRISLEVDHMDGNTTNNDIPNIRLLCPNCHSQTPTWRGRNVKRPRSQ